MMKLGPIYFILAHFWITTPDDKAKPMTLHVHSQSLPDHLSGSVCSNLTEELLAIDKEDPKPILLGDTKVLLNYYSCLPIYIDKDSLI